MGIAGKVTTQASTYYVIISLTDQRIAKPTGTEKQPALFESDKQDRHISQFDHRINHGHEVCQQ